MPHVHNSSMTIWWKTEETRTEKGGADLPLSEDWMQAFTVWNARLYFQPRLPQNRLHVSLLLLGVYEVVMFQKNQNSERNRKADIK